MLHDKTPPANLPTLTPAEAAKLKRSASGLIRGANEAKLKQPNRGLIRPPTVEKPPTVEPPAPADIAKPTQLAPAPEDVFILNLNPLSAYPSYTYSISLHLLSSEEYNKTVGKQEYKPTNVLIASAGRRDNIGKTFPRNEFFNEDFYFTNLDIMTIVGFNVQSRASNAITINFTINEPHGMTLINRIIDATYQIDKDASYLMMPYLLQIDFYGINDAGEIIGIIPKTTKYIPIQLIKMDIKPGLGGTDYQIQATPFNHMAYDLSSITTPANFEVTASSIQSFFADSVDETVALRAASAQREAVAASTASVNNYINNALEGIAPDFRNDRTGRSIPAPPAAQSATFSPILLSSAQPVKVKSYTGAINAYQDSVGNTFGIAKDIYNFEFHADFMGESGSFGLTKASLDIRNTAMSNKNSVNLDRLTNADLNNIADITVKKNNFSSDMQIFSINTGTSIDVIINYVMKSSNYIQSQMKSPTNATSSQDEIAKNKKDKDKPLNWFKIVPQIKLVKYVAKNNTWQRIITYKIIPYTVYNLEPDAAPQGIATVPLKKYEYFYTGRNTDILDLQLEFNCLYYTAMTSYKKNIEKGTSIDIGTPATPTANNNSPSATDPVQPSVKRPETAIMRASAGSWQSTEADVAVQDVENSMLKALGGDMINVSLKIIGDPLFIKQDDIFYHPDMARKVVPVDDLSGDYRLTPNGSYRTDTGVMLVNITFRSPVDIDEETGMMKYEKKYQESSFSGMYGITEVANNFSGGQFTQTLELYRLPRQAPRASDITKPKADGNRESVMANNVLADAAPANTLAPTEDVAPGSNPIPETPPAMVDADQEKLMADAAEMKTTSEANSKINEDIEWNELMIAKLEYKVDSPLKQSMIADYEMKNRVLRSKLT